ncbi:hypothetical protein IMCC3317_01210 [Kordia antarctica]|uniref:YhhN-like protein n=1 Tax=Kordia antarctica TaxID=1218801 RepID=A0A7L4ZDR0_9FLAO|nr:hypothetical protein [Kordia antarctica]QHI34777.1 hypothetical protein IMCC3317_01210 [Kordia antarctica]
MDVTKPTHIAFIISGIITMLVAIFFEKFSLIYVQPFTVLTILIIYFTEKKEPTSVLYILSQIIGVIGGILLILGMREHLKAVSILFSFFYIFYLRMMYVRNVMKKGELKTYFYVALISLPVLYLYYSVIQTISSELTEVVLYFSVLMFFMLSYFMTSLYYYIKDKNQSNLWMLIAAINLGFMNIIIVLNELYMYETMFTVIVVLCSLFIQFFVLKFMLYDENEDDYSLISTLNDELKNS